MTIKNNSQVHEYYFEEGCYITEFWNENSDKQVSIAKARLGPGEKTLCHFLTDTTERYFILSGQGQVFLEGQAGTPVKEDDVVFIPAGMKQSIENTGNNDLIFLAICSPRFKPDNYNTCA